MRSQYTVRVGVAVIAGALSAACGTTTPSSSAPSSTAASPVPSSASPAPLPTLSEPGKPPKEPTDNLPETGWVAGMVTRGGSGPCYGLTADDGTRYALYNADGITLKDKARVKVKLETTLLKIYCGPGNLMAMTAAEPIG
ncbi:hypothetical protein [Actinoplanes sp. HUAS TT8]|uniref:hypothetical protein n=1 Tax=Actinoplanes sp. HUAS TT8 TaxID=3447453 RepID=UPI003F526167